MNTTYIRMHGATIKILKQIFKWLSRHGPTKQLWRGCGTRSPGCLEDGTHTLSRNVVNQLQPTTHNIAEERKSRLHGGESLESRNMWLSYSYFTIRIKWNLRISWHLSTPWTKTCLSNFKIMAGPIQLVFWGWLVVIRTTYREAQACRKWNIALDNQW